MTRTARRLHKIAAILRGGGKSFETVVVDDIRIRWPLNQSHKYWYGEHPDARLIKFLINHFPEQGVFLDIGANVGLYSVALARSLGSRFKGIAFEPCPSTVQCLKANIDLNGVQTVETRQIALSSCEGTLTLSNYPDGLNNFALSDHKGDYPTVEVPCMTLDNFCARENIVPAQCKIDVEAHELHVLVGGQSTFQRYRPVLLVEVHGTSVTAPDRDAILCHLKNWGYKSIADVSGRSITTLPERTCHILCTP